MFDRFVTVDWSASNTPKLGKDSIWVCDMPAIGSARAWNLPTRLAAEAHVRDLLVRAVGRDERVLVGFDFPYGYPVGFAAALGLPGTPWRAVWDFLASNVTDDRRTNANNRFDVASMINAALSRPVFWGRPPSMTHLSALSPKKDRVSYQSSGDPAGLEEWRLVERVLRGRGSHPQQVWKLLGAGSVGSQALTGIPVVARLRDDPKLRDVSQVWPFEVAAPDLPTGSPAIIHAEIWPRLASFAVASGQVQDEAQVLAQAEEYRSKDRSGELARLFAAAQFPTARDEGWILGA
jgi:precorrin-8X/cobalt-precorrin-8 methylmutase